ncbi:MAG: hypothetical protein ILP11_03490 [Alphaproteobacteria bacterium]|nr:hypothetical protein [Alphaproteobacteria bacterium]
MAHLMQNIIERVFGKHSPNALSDLVQDIQHDQQNQARKAHAAKDRYVQKVGEQRRQADPHMHT